MIGSNVTRVRSIAQILAATAAVVGLACLYSTMTDARQSIGLALAVIVEARDASRAEAIDIVAVAALRPRAEGQHDPLPFGAVGPDRGPVQPIGDQMSGLVGNGLGKEILGVACQDRGIVANPM